MGFLLRQDALLYEFSKHRAPAAVSFPRAQTVLVHVQNGPLDHCGDLQETNILGATAVNSRADNPESDLVWLTGENRETLDPVVAKLLDEVACVNGVDVTGFLVRQNILVLHFISDNLRVRFFFVREE